MVRILFRFLPVLAIVISPFASSAKAAPVAQLLVGLDSDPQAMPLLFQDLGGGVFAAFGASEVVDLFSVTWQLLVKPDPNVAADDTVFLGGSIALTNQSGEEQTFLVQMTLDVVSPLSPATLMGYFAGVTLKDQDVDGAALLTDAGQPMFLAQIDGSTAVSALPNPIILLVDEPDGEVLNSDASASFPIPDLPGPPVSSSIGFVHKFTLSAGDSARMTNLFGATTAIPEVGGLTLAAVAAACGGLGWVGRRAARVWKPKSTSAS
jgi:hypothetical protein